MKLKQFIVIVIAVLTGISSFAQSTRPTPNQVKKSEKRERINSIIRQEEEGDVSFRKHVVYGPKLASDGYGLSFEIGKYKSLRRTTLWQFELSEKMHNKEEKLRNSSLDIFNNTSYKFGKANNFYQFKVGYGEQYLIGGKSNKNGTAVSAIFGTGLSLGLVKPYYVDANDNNNQRIRYKFIDTLPGGIRPQYLGASGFTVGWNELKLKPGIYAKTALRFDVNRFNEAITAVETGVNAEYYSSKILQMTYGTNSKIEKAFFFNAYVAVVLGKRK